MSSSSSPREADGRQPSGRATQTSSCHLAPWCHSASPPRGCAHAAKRGGRIEDRALPSRLPPSVATSCSPSRRVSGPTLTRAKQSERPCPSSATSDRPEQAVAVLSRGAVQYLHPHGVAASTSIAADAHARHKEGGSSIIPSPLLSLPRRAVAQRKPTGQRPDPNASRAKRSPLPLLCHRRQQVRSAS